MTNILILLGYVVSVVVAIPFTFGWSWLLHHLVEAKEVPPPVRNKWIPLMMGVLERAVITTIIGWDLPGSAVFVIGWIALKSAGSWRDLQSETPGSRALASVRLLGTLLSVIFALIGGLMILNCNPSGSDS